MGETEVKETEIFSSFLVKTNILINVNILVNVLSPYILNNIKTKTYRSGKIIALKYKNILIGEEEYFKKKTGFKNACHLIMSYTLIGEKRIKKLIHVKITAVTLQVMGVLVNEDVQKVVFKLFVLLEKINKSAQIFSYTNASPKTSARVKNNRLEIVIVPVLNNYVINLPANVKQVIFKNYSKIQIAQKFSQNKFISFIVPNNPAITIKKMFTYEEYSKLPIQYVTWSRARGQSVLYIEYDSYTKLLDDSSQKLKAQGDKYLTMWLYSSGKILVSGFHQTLVKEGLKHFLDICNQF